MDQFHRSRDIQMEYIPLSLRDGDVKLFQSSLHLIIYIFIWRLVQSGPGFISRRLEQAGVASAHPSRSISNSSICSQKSLAIIYSYIRTAFGQILWRTFYGFRSTDSQIHVAIALQSWVLETDESIHQLSSQVSSQDKTTRWFIWLASKFWVIKKLKGISFTRSNYFISEKTSSYVAPLTILKSDAANTPHVCVVAVNFSNSI